MGAEGSGAGGVQTAMQGILPTKPVVSLALFVIPVVLLFTLFAESRVGKA